MKLTAEQIKQALEFCANCECNDEKTEKECALINMSFCKNYLRKQSLDYINRLEAENIKLQAEIERLNKLVVEKHTENNRLHEYLQYTKADTINEFAERLKARAREHSETNARIVYECQIDNLVKEMVGDCDE